MTDDSPPRKPPGPLRGNLPPLPKMPDWGGLPENFGLTQPGSQRVQASEPAQRALLWGHWRSTKNPDWVLQLRPAAPAPPIPVDGQPGHIDGVPLRHRPAPEDGLEFIMDGQVMNQMAQGRLRIVGGRLRGELQLLRSGETVHMDLGTVYGAGLQLVGHGRVDAEERPITLDCVGVDPSGMWQDASETTLLFAESEFDFVSSVGDGRRKPAVTAKVLGQVFGRMGKGEATIDGLHVHIIFEARDFRGWNAFSDEARKQHPFIRDQTLKERYVAQARRGDWWGSDSLLIGLQMTPDGRALAGSVSPLRDLLDRKQDIEAPLHLEPILIGLDGQQVFFRNP